MICYLGFYCTCAIPKFIKADFILFFKVLFQHCFICLPSECTVSEDAEIEPRSVATLIWHSQSNAQASNHSARSHLQSARSHPIPKLYCLVCLTQISVAKDHFYPYISKILTCKRGFFPSCMSDSIRPEPFHFRGLLHIYTVINVMAGQC
jgi:hypothetical protein